MLILNCFGSEQIFHYDYKKRLNFILVFSQNKTFGLNLQGLFFFSTFPIYQIDDEFSKKNDENDKINKKENIL